MIAFWANLPFALQLVILALIGGCAGGLANCVLFAVSNVNRMTNAWAPSEDGTPVRTWHDRIPIIGWLRLRHTTTAAGPAVWVGPLALEIVAAVALPLYYWCEVAHGGLVPSVIGFWMGVPLTARYATLAILGLLGGALANYVIYTQSHMPRPIAPWASPDPSAPPRKRSDAIPIIGWIGLSREASLHGRGFWVRPMLIEAALAALMPALYWYETQYGGLLPPSISNNPKFLSWFEPVATQIFLGHAILLLLMVCATFIDFDEQTIPDIITIPGTVVALMLGIVVMTGSAGQVAFGSFMPTTLPVCEPVERLRPTTFDSPWFDVPFAASQWATSTGWLTGLAIWSGWCFALADRRFSRLMLRRRGLQRTVEFFFASLFHHWTWKVLVALWVFGAAAITVVWGVGGQHWYGLFTALVGLAVGGGTIWAIRIVASWAMDMEAMGFGDVTLMAMIGAFIGWQGATLGFFLSPFAAIAIVLVQYIVTKNRHVPFGPYLCAGSLLTIVGWDAVYNQWLACKLLLLWPMLKWLGITCLGLMGVTLFISRMVKTALAGFRES